MESFGDLIAEAEQEVESFESFDDVVAEAEIEVTPEDEPEAQAVVEAEAEIADDEEMPSEPGDSPKRRKKRISFV